MLLLLVIANSNLLKISIKMDNDQEAIMKNKDSLIENFVDDLKEVIAKLEVKFIDLKKEDMF